MIMKAEKIFSTEDETSFRQLELEFTTAVDKTRIHV
jgi:hypothetical protein